MDDAPAAARLSASDLRVWLGRAIGVGCLANLMPALLLLRGQVGSLHPLWQAVCGGSVLAFSLLIPIYAWLREDVRRFAGWYAVSVLVGLATWPLAWMSTRPPSDAPWIWMCAGTAAICAAFAAGTRWGLTITVLTAILYGLVRRSLSGGATDLIVAVQDALTLLVLPSGLILVLHVFVSAAESLDRSAERRERYEGAVLIEQALTDQRRVLDGIIHDEVMTTLVAAVHNDQTPAEVSALATRAMASLDRAAEVSDVDAPVTASQLRRLIADMVEAVAPEAVVTLVPPPSMWSVPSRVAGPLGAAAREAALNAHRHAAGSSIRVEVQPSFEDRHAAIRVRIVDDGPGFDPNSVSAERLGLRVSVRDRLLVIGGTAAVASFPGRGTTVTLEWRGDTAAADSGADQQLNAALEGIGPATFVGLVWLVMAVQIGLGWASLGAVSDPAMVFIANVLAVLAAGLALGSGSGDRRIGFPFAALVVGSLILLSLLVHTVLPHAHWPGYAAWHTAVVQILLIVVLVRGQAALAWLGMTAFLVEVGHWGISHEMGGGDMFRVAFGPVLWLALATLLLRGLRRIGAELVRSQGMSREAAWRLASSFSQLVLHEVWLRDLTEQVGPLLRRLADPSQPLSAEQREAARVVEARLRDALRAGNLVSDNVADAIGRARARGVEVTLVDNRGSELPAEVRKAALAHLEGLVTASTAGRIVARTAPEGYPEFVTILAVAPGRSPELTTIDGHGRLSMRTP